MKIVADAHIPFLQGVFEPWAEVEYLPGSQIRRTHLAGAEALIIRTRTRADKQLLENTGVKIVASATIGTDHIDLEWCRENGIKVVNAPGCNSGSVMQYVTVALAWLARRKRFRFQEKTLGIIGVGNVGSKVEKTARALGFNVLLNDPPRVRKEGSTGFSGLEELLQKSDIVSLHVPLTRSGRDKTLGLVDERFLEMAKEGMILINTSRGPVVDDQALKNWKRSGKSGGLVLDVWNHEPVIDRDLMAMCDLATPHIAGYSVDGKANGTAMSVQAVSRFLDLPPKDWYPLELPFPEEPRIFIDNKKMDVQECFEHAVLHTYPIHRDDSELRKNPDTFESLRGNYPPRREFQNYTIQLAGKDDILVRKLKEMHFNIIND